MFWWNEAVEVIEATDVVEAVEVIEAPEVPDARKIIQYEICKLSFSVKRHKWAKNIEIFLKTSLHWVHSNSFLHNFFTPFLLVAVEDRDVTFNQIEES